MKLLRSGYTMNRDGVQLYRVPGDGGKWVAEDQIARLDGLPVDLQHVAAEFLTLHDAWGTEFWVRDIDGQLYLQWRLPKLYACFNCWPGSKRRGHRHPIWELITVERNRYSTSWKMPGTPLRRSADFAEFVQRFKRDG